MTLLTLLTTSKLRIYALAPLQPLDETTSTLSTMSECQRHRCRPSHRPSRPLNVNALTWLALQIVNEPSATDAGAPWAELPPLTHVANYHAGLVIRHALLRLPVKARYNAVPWVTRSPTWD